MLATSADDVSAEASAGEDERIVEDARCDANLVRRVGNLPAGTDLVLRFQSGPRHGIRPR
jgi:hypothetical protein